MDYMGCKGKLTDWLFSHIGLRSGRSSKPVFLDACAGTGAVSLCAARLGYKVLAVDLMQCSTHVIRGRCCTPASVVEVARGHIAEMSNLAGIDGFFFQNYSESAGRLYFTDANAARIDACRVYVERRKRDYRLYSYLLMCLIEAATRVMNTTGVQGTYLKHLKTRAKGALEIREEDCDDLDVNVFGRDITLLLSSRTFRTQYAEDICYIDPPYTSRAYGLYYHLYETLVRYDNPRLYGKAGVRDYKNETRSGFCSKKTFEQSLSAILKFTTAKTVFLSYSSDGLMNDDQVRDIIGRRCRSVNLHYRPQRRYKAGRNGARRYNRTPLMEYLYDVKL